MEAVVIESPFKLEKFSSFKKIIRKLSYCLRWRKKTFEGILTVEELNAAKLAILKRCEKENFYDAYEKISKGQPLYASDQSKVDRYDYNVDCNNHIQVMRPNTRCCC